MSKLKALGVLGIPYNVGWKGGGIDEGPSALRRAGLLDQLRRVSETVVDLGDVNVNLPPRDDTNPKLLNPHQVVAVCRTIAPRASDVCRKGYFPLVLGAEDSVIMGIVEGFQQGLSEQIGLIYLDAHGDFNTPETTPSGLIGGMGVAILAGRGPDQMTDIFGHKPQLREEQIVIFGARDFDPPELKTLKESKVHLYAMDKVNKLGPKRAMTEATERLLRFCGKIYVHMDIDVLDPSEMKALHVSVPNCLGLAECKSALRIGKETGKLCGLVVMVFDPLKDSCGKEAGKLNTLIVESLCE